VQIEQLHRNVPLLKSMSASKRTAPQWQLPWQVLIGKMHDALCLFWCCQRFLSCLAQRLVSLQIIIREMTTPAVAALLPFT
jgi:hypothetical protein